MSTSTAADIAFPLLDHRATHGVCWGAILAGAAGAASLSLILLMLGVGLGLSTASPWSGDGPSAEAIGVSTILWLSFTQLAASAMGGYLAGRLRVRWISLHPDESYFRDTAHGFLAWSIATLATAALLTSAIGTIVSGGAKAGAVTAVVAPAVAASASSSDAAYFTDSLFRSDVVAAAPGSAASSADANDSSNGRARSGEVARIFAAAGAGALPPEDVKYVGQLVAQRTGLAQADAEKRVTDTYNRMRAKIASLKDEAKVAADKARKASAMATLWAFISLLIGAFIASLAATLGARHRDQF